MPRPGAVVPSSSSSFEHLDSDAERELEQALNEPTPTTTRHIRRRVSQQVTAPSAGEHTTKAAAADVSSARKARLDAIAAEKKVALAAKRQERGARLRVGSRVAGRRAPQLPDAGSDEVKTAGVSEDEQLEREADTGLALEAAPTQVLSNAAQGISIL